MDSLILGFHSYRMNIRHRPSSAIVQKPSFVNVAPPPARPLSAVLAHSAHANRIGLQISPQEAQNDVINPDTMSDHFTNPQDRKNVTKPVIRVHRSRPASATTFRQSKSTASSNISDVGGIPLGSEETPSRTSKLPVRPSSALPARSLTNTPRIDTLAVTQPSHSVSRPSSAQRTSVTFGHNAQHVASPRSATTATYAVNIAKSHSSTAPVDPLLALSVDMSIPTRFTAATDDISDDEVGDSQSHVSPLDSHGEVPWDLSAQTAYPTTGTIHASNLYKSTDKNDVTPSSSPINTLSHTYPAPPHPIPSEPLPPPAPLLFNVERGPWLGSTTPSVVLDNDTYVSAAPKFQTIGERFNRHKLELQLDKTKKNLQKQIRLGKSDRENRAKGANAVPDNSSETRENSHDIRVDVDGTGRLEPLQVHTNEKLVVASILTTIDHSKADTTKSQRDTKKKDNIHLIGKCVALSEMINEVKSMQQALLTHNSPPNSSSSLTSSRSGLDASLPDPHATVSSFMSTIDTLAVTNPTASALTTHSQTVSDALANVLPSVPPTAATAMVAISGNFVPVQLGKGHLAGFPDSETGIGKGASGQSNGSKEPWSKRVLRYAYQCISAAEQDAEEDCDITTSSSEGKTHATYSAITTERKKSKKNDDLFPWPMTAVDPPSDGLFEVRSVLSHVGRKETELVIVKLMDILKKFHQNTLISDSSVEKMKELMEEAQNVSREHHDKITQMEKRLRELEKKNTRLITEKNDLQRNVSHLQEQLLQTHTQQQTITASQANEVLLAASRASEAKAYASERVKLKLEKSLEEKQNQAEGYKMRMEAAQVERDICVGLCLELMGKLEQFGMTPNTVWESGSSGRNGFVSNVPASSMGRYLDLMKEELGKRYAVWERNDHIDIRKSAGKTSLFSGQSMLPRSSTHERLYVTNTIASFNHKSVGESNQNHQNANKTSTVQNGLDASLTRPSNSTDTKTVRFVAP